MGGYAVQLLGPPEVRQDGVSLAFKSRKALALLTYLTLETRPCARETLAGLLWPDSEQEVARSALRTTVSQLRGLIGERLAVTKQTVALIWTDDDDLDLHRLRTGDVNAWQGDLLEGLQLNSEAFETWLTGQRETLRAQADQAFEQCSATLLGTDAARAADTATRWLSLDRLNEAAWRRLILARLATGQLGSAREAFETCKALLASELDVQPAPETLALQTRLQTEADPVSVPAELPAFLVGGPLVGRQMEFMQLVEAYRLAASGTPRIVLLSGEPGIGKTRLAGELLAWAREHGAPLLRGRALEGAFAPFAPLVEALSREVSALRTRLSSTLRGDLARLLPEIYDGPPPDSGGDMKAQILSALSVAIQALSPSTDTLDPLVLLIDDVQWTDASSQDALLHLAARLADVPRPLLLLFTARAEYLGTGSPLSGWLGKLRRHLPLQDLQLVSLGASDTDHLLTRSVPKLSFAVHTRLTIWLFQQTAGHPLYLTETIKSLLESGALREGVLDEKRLPKAAEGLRAAIGERLARLTPASLALAQGAAVLSQGATFETLRGVADLDEVTALSGYEELLNSGLLLEHGDLAQLSHDRVRETLRDALSGPRRRLLHSRAYRVLEGVKSPPAVLAGHALDAGLRDEAVTWFERAAEAAQEVGALAEVVSASKTALSLIPMEQQQHARRYILVRAIFIGISSGRSRDFQAAFAFIDRHIQSLAGDLREERATCRAFRLLQATWQGSVQDSQTLDDLFEEAMELDSPFVARVIYSVQVDVSFMTWDWERIERAIDGYENIARESHDTYALLRSENVRLIIEAHRNGYEQVFDRQLDLVVKALDFYLSASSPFSNKESLFLSTVREMHTGALCVKESEAATWKVHKLITEKLSRFKLSLRVDAEIGMWLTASGEYEAALHYLRRVDTRSWWFTPPDLTFHTALIAKCLAHLGHVEEPRALLAGLSNAELKQAFSNEPSVTKSMLADAYFALSDPMVALGYYRDVLLGHRQSTVLGSLKGIAQILMTEDPQLTAYCVGVVLAGKVTRVLDRQQAEAILTDLRAHGSTEEIEAALTEGKTSSLREVVKYVRMVLSRRRLVPLPIM